MAGRAWIPALAWSVALPFGLGACGSGDGSTAGGTGATLRDGGANDAPNDSGALEGSCPPGFTPRAGHNVGFPSDGVAREFHVLLPPDLASPRPVFVSLTGTVQQELDFAAQSGIDRLVDRGFVVLAPVRTCSQNGTNCAQIGSDGRIWEPWYDGSQAPSDDEGPDVRFVEAMVRCSATVWPIAADRIWVGGISAGGSFSNRNLTFNSELFAGGVPASGNWYGGLAAPMTPRPMSRSIVILIWGGPTDVWPAGNPIADYAPETRLAARFYAAQPEVVTVSCSGTHGHIWPAAMTPWLADTLESHPKGTAPSDFVLGDPPAGFGCVLGEYTDH